MPDSNNFNPINSVEIICEQTPYAGDQRAIDIWATNELWNNYKQGP